MKKALAFVCAALLLIAASLSMGETEPLTFSSEEVKGAVGDIVTVPVSLAMTPPAADATMDAVQFSLKYDASAVECVGIERDANGYTSDILNADYTCAYNVMEGEIIFAAYSTIGRVASGLLVSLQFKILSGTGSGVALTNIVYSFYNKTSGDQQVYRQDLVELPGISVGNAAIPTLDPAQLATTTPYSQIVTITPAPDRTAAVTEGTPIAATAPTVPNSDSPAATEDTAASTDPNVTPEESAVPGDISVTVGEPTGGVTEQPNSSPASDAATEKQESNALTYVILGLGGVGVVLIVAAIIVLIARKGKSKKED